MGWGSWRHGRRGAGPVRSSPPKTVFPGACGSRETVFLLETSSTADATARTGLDGPCGPDNPCVGAAHSGREGEPDLENSIFHIHLRCLRDFSCPIHPTGLVRLNLSLGALGSGLDMHLIWISTGTGTCVLFASVHCVISRPVLAGLGETLMTAFLWRSARNASERLHPHHTYTTHVHHSRTPAQVLEGSRWSGRPATF